MNELLAFDLQTLRRFDADNRMHVECCNLSKAVVNPYYGREIPGHEALGLDPSRIYQLYRHPDELVKAADSFNNMPLLITHVGVNADDPKMNLTVGTIGSDARFEAPYLKASIAVWTSEAIALIESKKQAQLSSSYRYTPDMTPGVTSGGVAYDGIMRDIVANHVALVEQGRAGPDVYVSDSLPLELRKMRFPKHAALLKTLVPTATDEQILALDAAMEEEAEAMDEKEMAAKTAADKKAKDEKDAEDKKAADAKAAADALNAGPRMGEVGAALDAALKAGKYVTAADAAKLTSDAVTAINELHAARELVKPIVGVVAMDSAAEVLKFALDAAKVDVTGVSPSAYSALVKAELRSRAHKVVSIRPAPLASDAASDLSVALGCLSAIRQG